MRPGPRTRLALEEGAADRRGSALVLVLIALVVGGLLVGQLVSGSAVASRDASGGVASTGAWYAAHGGLWAAADSIRAGGGGNLDGDVDAATLAPFAGPDVDGDGFVDFGPRASLLARGSGAFEVRARLEGSGRSRVRAVGVCDGVLCALEAVFEERRVGPFRWAAFGVSDVSLLGNEKSDSYDSDVQAWGATPVTLVVAGKQLRGSSGGVGSDGDIAVGGNSMVYGDAYAAGAVTVSGSGAVSGDIGVLTPPLAPALPTWTVPGPGDPALANGAIAVPYGGALTLSSGTTTLPPGKYVFSSLTIGGGARLDVDVSAGDVEIYLTQPGGTNLRVLTNGSLQPTVPSKANGGSIIVRNVGKATFASNARVNVTVVAGVQTPGDPVKFQYYSSVVGSGPGFDLDMGNGRVSGTLYAPRARLRFGSTAELWGSSVTDTVTSNGGAFFHFDESLRGLSPPGMGEVVLTPVLLHALR